MKNDTRRRMIHVIIKVTTTRLPFTIEQPTAFAQVDARAEWNAKASRKMTFQFDGAPPHVLSDRVDQCRSLQREKKRD